MTNRKTGLLAGVIACIALPAQASTLTAITAISANGYGQNTSVNTVEGFRFRPNEDLFVHELGFFDSFSNGLIRAYTVGIVLPDNTIVASVSVPAGTAGRLDGPVNSNAGGLLGGSAFRYAALPQPVQLTAGTTYALVALVTRTTTDELPFPDSVTYSDRITVAGAGLGGFFDCRLAAVGTGCPTNATQITQLRWPTQYASGSRYVNFTFSVVPLPAALPLLGTAVGLLAPVALRRRRRMAASA
ncbi:MAG: hypothetical protein JNM50_04935 [Chromatiales bacterium]|jgi:hypothetical protein|nr:hypothetical protein [Chromatiales bacterium]